MQTRTDVHIELLIQYKHVLILMNDRLHHINKYLASDATTETINTYNYQSKYRTADNQSCISAFRSNNEDKTINE